jgi:hypothetical protein
MQDDELVCRLDRNSNQEDDEYYPDVMPISNSREAENSTALNMQVTNASNTSANSEVNTEEKEEGEEEDMTSMARALLEKAILTGGASNNSDVSTSSANQAKTATLLNQKRKSKNESSSNRNYPKGNTKTNPRKNTGSKRMISEITVNRVYRKVVEMITMTLRRTQSSLFISYYERQGLVGGDKVVIVRREDDNGNSSEGNGPGGRIKSVY